MHGEGWWPKQRVQHTLYPLYLGKCYQPQPLASADNPYHYLDYSGYHKDSSSNNCLIYVVIGSGEFSTPALITQPLWGCSRPCSITYQNSYMTPRLSGQISYNKFLLALMFPRSDLDGKKTPPNLPSIQNKVHSGKSDRYDHFGVI